ncbi:hypothetical protein [Filimonas effusa]|uniref:Uncharacterized protein n=1 Tax=Filimonas effusa TaxID=2508721 RepID=A0A4Q1D5C7_9BACT|nr:hypothetical protein [Filimonas effusa]RXK83043.1 hypothetical protein ESB13_13030 [Filimonas effusa]
MKYLKKLTGLLAFLVVLLTMPLGHALMIVMEKTLGHTHVFTAAFLLGFAGLLLLLWGARLKKENSATFAGLFAGLFIWTGWVEFGFVYFAHRYHVAPLVENGVVVTKPEYLIMPASAGFLVVIVLHYLFSTHTGCLFFCWLQKQLHIPVPVRKQPKAGKNFSVITAMELIAILWTFYLLLLFVYDQAFLGDRHAVTYLVAFGSLLWSVLLMRNLARIRQMGYAIRYAIPTVIIFWNFVEILGRWNILNEIWVKPYEYWLEMVLTLAVFVVLFGVSLLERKRVVIAGFRRRL